MFAKLLIINAINYFFNSCFPNESSLLGRNKGTAPSASTPCTCTGVQKQVKTIWYNKILFCSHLIDVFFCYFHSSFLCISFSNSHCISMSLSLSPTLFLYLSSSFFLSLPPSPSLPLSHALYLSLSLYLFLSPSLSLLPFLSLPPSLFFSIFLSHSHTNARTQFFSISISLTLYLSIIISFSLFIHPFISHFFFLLFSELRKV